MSAIECRVCGCTTDRANAMYATRYRPNGGRRVKTVVCDHCRASIIDAQASTMTMKTEDAGGKTTLFDFRRLDDCGKLTRDSSEIELTPRAIRTLPTKIARPLGLKA